MKKEQGRPPKKKKLVENFLLTNILCSIRTKTLLSLFSIFLIFFGIIVGIILGIFSDTYFKYERNSNLNSKKVNGM
jgi:hypothetical protein